MRFLNADGAAGTAGAGDGGTGAAGAAAAADGGDVNYDAPIGARSGEGAAAGEAADGGDAGDAGDGGGAAGDGDGAAGAAGATGEGTEGAAGGKKRTIIGDMQALRATNKELKSELQERDELINSWRPILQRLDGRPDLQRAVLDGTITIAQAEGTKASDERAELTEIAHDYGWFLDDGVTPDLKKAEKHLGRIRKEAERIAGTQVQPVRQHVANQQANARIDQAIRYCEEHQHADPEFVRAEFIKVARSNPDALLNDQHGNALYEMIVGKALMAGKVFKAGAGGNGNGRRAAAAGDGDGDGNDKTFVVTEGTGGKRGTGGPKLTAAEKQLGEQYGLTDKDWERAEAHSQVRRGYTRLTED